MVRKTVTALKANKDVIIRKVIILAGTAVGVVVAGALLNKMTEGDDTIIVEETVVEDAE